MNSSNVFRILSAFVLGFDRAMARTYFLISNIFAGNVTPCRYGPSDVVSTTRKIQILSQVLSKILEFGFLFTVQHIWPFSGVFVCPVCRKCTCRLI